MNNKSIAFTIIGISLAVLIAGVFLASKAPSAPGIVANQEANVEVPETEHSWGDIDINGGDVEKTFIINNQGTGILQLANVKSSCMCTEAKLIIDGQESPFFGMHSNSSWTGEVEPGGQAELLVVFDPLYHGPSGIGQISRIISIETNDTQYPRLEFRLTGNVIN